MLHDSSSESVLFRSSYWKVFFKKAVTFEFQDRSLQLWKKITTTKGLSNLFKVWFNMSFLLFSKKLILQSTASAFYFYQGFLLLTLTIHRTTREGRVPSFTKLTIHSTTREGTRLSFMDTGDSQDHKGRERAIFHGQWQFTGLQGNAQGHLS